jgi:pimeloyl-[acyl-carrier protein] methyl ester esterase
MKDIVLLHGWGMSSAVFDALRRELAPGCHAQALELPGYGCASAEPYTLDVVVRALSEAAPPRCVVLGWSLGALVALVWAARDPKQVERLVIVAGTPCFVQREDWPHGIRPAVLCAFARELQCDPERTLRRFAALQAHADENAKAVTRALDAAAARGEGVGDGVLESGLRILREADLRPLLKSIPQRALLVHGEHDELVPVAAAAYLAAALRDAQLALVQGAGHAPFLSRTGEVARRILDFLDG